jgi:hypothetical protein
MPAKPIHPAVVGNLKKRIKLLEDTLSAITYRLNLMVSLEGSDLERIVEHIDGLMRERDWHEDKSRDLINNASALEIAVIALQQIEHEDYRGPRPHSAIVADQALQRILTLKARDERARNKTDNA